MQFTKLRLSNFKSFADASDLLIEPGLTGVVGPNGCGKSNLVEALRWVMGETSAKQLRGGEMDDVIFAGTHSRPPRNLAEVAIHLDNRDRTAPAIFNEFEDIEITRRIERGHGSAYRVNGREVRAKDVQLLFADQATGARSTALVSQGSIGALIGAKPTARRMILEEAAGITGLHSRRHEAELRLRAAESNLMRLDDVLAALDAQLQTLKRQARQANRYRSLSDHIRSAEAAVLYLRWTEAQGALSGARDRLAAAAEAVTSLTSLAGRLSAAQAEAGAILPDLRTAEAAAAAALQRLTLERDSLDAEEARLTRARQELESRVTQIDGDRQREKDLADEANRDLARLAEEAKEIEAARALEASAQAATATQLADAAKTAEAEENAVTELTGIVAAAEAQRGALSRRLEDLEQRNARLRTQAADIARQQDELAAASGDKAALAKAAEAVEAARAAADSAQSAATTAERTRSEALNAESVSRDALQAANAARDKMDAEAAALAGLLAEAGGDQWPPLIDKVRVEPGFEAALGAALGDDLNASHDEAAPLHWRALPPFSPPPLPAGAKPLATLVTGPDLLTRRLSQTGIVADEATGKQLQGALATGQRLVSQDGALWRWDGFTIAAGAPTAAANRLRQRNRLLELRAELAAGEEEATAMAARFENARAAAVQASEDERGARAAQRQADAAHMAALDAHTRLAQKAAATLSRRQSLTEAAARLEGEITETAGHLDEARTSLADLPDSEAERARLAEQRDRLAAIRAALAEARSRHDQLKREAEARRHRLAAIDQERRAAESRASGAARHLADLATRRDTALQEREQLMRLPAEIATKRTLLFSHIERAEETRKEAADRLAEAETRAAEAGRDLRAAEEKLASAREDRARCEGLLAQAEQTGSAIRERATENLDCTPGQLRTIAGLADGAPDPDREAADRKLERLSRERDTMGPVNLRAEAEAAEQEARIQSIETERADLLAAIAKLRSAISTLNREGRERLLAAFEAVDKHFQELFVRLFGGGRAHLTLTESDDPLEAGLEIMAQPPGKRLQVLSLLSGGERALTALALLFAVFLTNPAPICVLDEVDAPLDDANVDRFCALVNELAHSLSTRFLVITHHRMTMARMDRLFGVTMAERGISQLVSVDLQTAARLRATG